jgi:hypothetical protein
MDHFNKYDGWPYAKLPHAVLWDWRLLPLEITMYALLSARSMRAITFVETLRQIGEDIGILPGEAHKVLDRLAGFGLIRFEQVDAATLRIWLTPLEQVYEKTGRKFQSMPIHIDPQAAPVPASPAPASSAAGPAVPLAPAPMKVAPQVYAGKPPYDPDRYYCPK